MPGPTTIQVAAETAAALREAFPGTTYDEGIKRMLTVQESHTIPFKKTVTALQEDSEDHRVPFDGVITDVVMDFPSGCQFLVYVRLIYFEGKTENYVIPSLEDSYIIFDDANPHFRISYPVRANGKLRVEWKNYDGGNSHTVPVIVTVMARLMPPIPVMR